MNKQEFTALFLDELARAAQIAEERFKIEVPRSYQIRLSPRGTPHGLELRDTEAAVDSLYQEDNLFPRFIDIGIEAVSISRKYAIALVVATITERVPFHHTWNYQTGHGPFKQIILEEFRIVPD